MTWWRTRPHFIAGELLQTDRTGTATAIFFPTIKFPVTQFHIILYICKYLCVIMCHQIRFEGSELSWQLSWDRAPVFSEWPSGGDTSRMSISRLRTTTWNSKLSWPKSRDWGDPKMSYNTGSLGSHTWVNNLCSPKWSSNDYVIRCNQLGV